VPDRDICSVVRNTSRTSRAATITTDAERQLERLIAVRATACRSGAAPMSSMTELVDWINDRRIVLVSGKSAIPNAAEAIAGRAIEGSWWGDPQGSLIFRLLSELEEEAPHYLDVPLVEGKHTLVSPRLAPVVSALASDPERRRRVVDTLKAPARELFEVLADGRTVRSDDGGHGGKVARSTRTALESGLLARSTSVHTVSGHHAAVLEGYGQHPPEGAPPAGRLRELLETGLRSAVVAEKGGVEKWFRFVEPDRLRRSCAVSELGADEIHAAGRVWLTLSASA